MKAITKSEFTEKEIRKLISDYQPCNYKNLITVLLIWESPITNIIENRSGCFDDYTEAEMFGTMLKEKYSKMNMKFSVYLIMDGYFKLI